MFIQGRVFADIIVFLQCTTILATFNILKAAGENGEKITPPIEHVGDLAL
jgi:hypothetical protein